MWFCLHTFKIHLAAVATSEFFNLCGRVLPHIYRTTSAYSWASHAVSVCDEAPDDWKRKVNVLLPIRRTHENRILICIPCLIRDTGADTKIQRYKVAFLFAWQFVIVCLSAFNRQIMTASPPVSFFFSFLADILRSISIHLYLIIFCAFSVYLLYLFLVLFAAT